jgi:hypothetical protein
VSKNDLYQRALKGLFKLRKSLSDISPNIKTCLHIFDHTLKPILLYGSEIWGAHTLPNSNKEFKLETTMDKFHSEKSNIKFSKFILGVHKKSSNFAVLGESDNDLRNLNKPFKAL